MTINALFQILKLQDDTFLFILLKAFHMSVITPCRLHLDFRKNSPRHLQLVFTKELLHRSLHTLHTCDTHWLTDRPSPSPDQ